MEESSPAGRSTRRLSRISVSEKIHIIQLVPAFGAEPPLGGVERFAAELCLALDKKKYTVMACAFRSFQRPSTEQVIRDLRSAGCEVYTGVEWDERRYYYSLWKGYQQLKTLLKNKPIDIIHSHSPRNDFAGMLLSRQRQVGLVRTTAVPNEWPNPLLDLLVYHLAVPLFFQAEVGVNQILVDNLDKRPAARLLKRRAHMINNAVNLERFQGPKIDKTAKKVSLGLPPGAIVVGSVGRLAEQKGFSYFICAAQQVLAQVKAEVTFVLVGSGELEEPLRKLCCDLGIERRFVFTGRRADIEEVLQTFDLFVSSSLWEGLPTVIMESIASGVPVIATAIPGSKELIKDGASGWLVPAGDPTALAQAILAALRDPALAQAYSQKAINVLQEVDIRRVAAQYDVLYDQLLAKRGNRG
jgi:glycosyltransferase involved in cell wall biosynthesis